VTSVQVVGMSWPHFTGALLESLRSIGVGDRNGSTGVMLLSSRVEIRNPVIITAALPVARAGAPLTSTPRTGSLHERGCRHVVKPTSNPGHRTVLVRRGPSCSRGISREACDLKSSFKVIRRCGSRFWAGLSGDDAGRRTTRFGSLKKRRCLAQR